MAAANTTLNPQPIPNPVGQSIVAQLTCLNAIRSLIRENADYATLPEPQKQAVDRILAAAEETAGLCTNLSKFR